MQYKIPVQIENEDRIILGLSLRQLMIILAFGAVAYGVFQKIAANAGVAADNSTKMVGAIIAFLILGVGIVIAKFNNHEMTFLPYILNWLRLRVNGAQRVWGQGIDSTPTLQIGYVSAPPKEDGKKSHAKSQQEIYASLEDKLQNL